MNKMGNHDRCDGVVLDFENPPCKGKEAIFFPEKGRQRRGIYNAARKICATCPYKDPCREYGIETRQQFGCWGGLSPDDIQTARKLRKEGTDYVYYGTNNAAG
jgi:hypothetical protein